MPPSGSSTRAALAGDGMSTAPSSRRHSLGLENRQYSQAMHTTPERPKPAISVRPMATGDSGAAPPPSTAKPQEEDRPTTDVEQKALKAGPSKPPSLIVEGVALPDGQALAVETLWSAELHDCTDPFSVDFVLSNGLTVVVDHPSPAVDDRWLVVAKDASALGRFQMLARFEQHAPQPGLLACCRLLLHVCASQVANDLSALVVLLVAMVLVGMRDSAPRRDARVASSSSSSSSSSSAALYPHQTEADEATYGSPGGEGAAIEAPMLQRLLGARLLANPGPDPDP